LARLNPVTVPSQVQISSSLHPQYQREWFGQYPYPACPYRPERFAVTAEIRAAVLEIKRGIQRQALSRQLTLAPLIPVGVEVHVPMLAIVARVIVPAQAPKLQLTVGECLQFLAYRAVRDEASEQIGIH
jgi:hypothetical protein